MVSSDQSAPLASRARQQAEARPYKDDAYQILVEFRDHGRTRAEADAAYGIHSKYWAFEMLVRATKISRNIEYADDAVQEALWAMWNVYVLRHQFPNKRRPQDDGALLWTIVKRKLVSDYRKRKRIAIVEIGRRVIETDERDPLERLPDETLAGAVESLIDVDHVWNVIEQLLDAVGLSRRDQQIMARTSGGDDPKEIAEDLQMTSEAVQRSLYRIRQRNQWWLHMKNRMRSDLTDDQVHIVELYNAKRSGNRKEEEKLDEISRDLTLDRAEVEHLWADAIKKLKRRIRSDLIDGDTP